MKSVSEINQWIYLILGLERLLGGRPKVYGTMLFVFVIVAGIAFAYYRWNDPRPLIDQADQQWNSQQFAFAVETYQTVLMKREPFLGSEFWIQEDRPRMYQRVILFKSQYVDRTEARDWCRRAMDEGIGRLTFDSEIAQQTWDEFSTKF